MIVKTFYFVRLVTAIGDAYGVALLLHMLTTTITLTLLAYQATKVIYIYIISRHKAKYIIKLKKDSTILSVNINKENLILLYYLLDTRSRHVRSISSRLFIVLSRTSVYALYIWKSSH